MGQLLETIKILFQDPKFVATICFLAIIGAVTIILVLIFRSLYLLKKGNSHYKKGQHQLAIRYYRQYLKYKPDNLEIITRLAGIYKKEELYDQAISLYRKAVRINPNDVSNFIQIGEIQERKGLLDEAITTYENLFKKVLSSTDRFRVRLSLAELYYKKGKVEEAINGFQIAKVLDPNNTQPYLRLAEIYRQKGDFTSVLEEYERIQSKKPETVRAITEALDDLRKEVKDVGSIIKIAELYKTFKDFGKATEVYEEGRKKFPSVELYMKLGKMYLSQEKYEEATREFKKAYEMDPNIVEKVLEEYRDLLRVNPANHLIRKALGEAYLKKGEIDRGIVEFNKLADISDFKDSSYLLLSRAYLQKGAVEKVFEYLAKIDPKTTPPDSVEEIYYSLGFLCERKKQPEQALKAYTKLEVIKKNYKDTPSRLKKLKQEIAYRIKELNNRAIKLVEEKKLDEALKVCRLAVELNPSFLPAQRNLGFIYLQTGKIQLAIEKFKELVKKYPEDERSFYSLGLAYVKDNDEEGLKKVLEEMRNLFPQSQYLSKLENYFRMVF